MIERLAQLYLDGLHAQALARCACHISITNPRLPADILHMRLIADACSEATNQEDSDGLHAQALTRCTCHGSITDRSLPSNILYMCLIADAHKPGHISQENSYGLHAQALARCACYCIVADGPLPTDILHMSLVTNARTRPGSIVYLGAGTQGGQEYNQGTKDAKHNAKSYYVSYAGKMTELFFFAEHTCSPYITVERNAFIFYAFTTQVTYMDRIRVLLYLRTQEFTEDPYCSCIM